MTQLREVIKELLVEVKNRQKVLNLASFGTDHLILVNYW
jgi:hypothetical protein